MVAGAPADDAPAMVEGKAGWLLEQFGNRFQLLLCADIGALAALGEDRIAVPTLVLGAAAASIPGVRALHDVKGSFAQRFDARDGSAWLLRPNQHVCARWRRADVAKIRAAVARATCSH